MAPPAALPRGFLRRRRRAQRGGRAGREHVPRSMQAMISKCGPTLVRSGPRSRAVLSLGPRSASAMHTTTTTVAATSRTASAVGSNAVTACVGPGAGKKHSRRNRGKLRRLVSTRRAPRLRPVLFPSPAAPGAGHEYCTCPEQDGEDGRKTGFRDDDGSVLNCD